MAMAALAAGEVRIPPAYPSRVDLGVRAHVLFAL